MVGGGGVPFVANAFEGPIKVVVEWGGCGCGRHWRGNENDENENDENENEKSVKMNDWESNGLRCVYALVGVVKRQYERMNPSNMPNMFGM